MATDMTWVALLRCGGPAAPVQPSGTGERAVRGAEGAGSRAAPRDGGPPPHASAARVAPPDGPALDSAHPPSVDALRLAALIADQPLPSDRLPGAAPPTTSPVPQERTSPALPDGLGATDLQYYVEQICTTAVHRSDPFPGLTTGRLRQLLAPGHKSLAALLLVWCDHAGVLAPPVSAATPLRHPRALLHSVPQELAARLRATPLPTADEVAAALHGGAP